MAQAGLIEQYDSAAPAWGAKLAQLGYGAAYREFIRQVSIHKVTGLRVCDIGTGSGAFARAFLAEHTGVAHLALVDPSDEMLISAETELQPVCGDLQCHQQTLENHRPETRYDVVLVAHVLEHSLDPVDALRRLWELVAPGGTLLMIVSRPHWCQWLIWLRWRHRWFTSQKINAMAAGLGMAETDVFRFRKGAPKRTSLGYSFFKSNQNEKD